MSQTMIAPGQEGLLEEFLQEMDQQGSGEGQAPAQPAQPADPLDQFLQDLDGQSQAEQPKDGAGLPEKFRGKSAEEIAAAYMELERKLGLRHPTEPAEPAEPQAPPPESYTPELGRQIYGETVASAIEAAGINPLAMAQALAAGKDVSADVTALVERGGLPRGVVETYLAGVAPAPQPPAGAGVLTDADAATLKASIGGEQEFQRVRQWAANNLSKEEIAGYDAVIESGNRDAAAGILRALKAMSGQRAEPTLLTGGAAAGDPPFESYQDIAHAMNATDGSGRNRYQSDAKYRAAVEARVARSNPK